MILYHYTDEKGLAGILESRTLFASTAIRNPRDVRYGNGQYLSNFEPGSKTSGQLAREFLRVPFAGHRSTCFVAIDVTGLIVVEGRPGVFVIPNNEPLDLSGRIVATGSIVEQ